MKYIHSLVIIVMFLTLTTSFIRSCLAQQANPDEYIVKLVYFYPKGTQPESKDRTDSMGDKTIKRVQEFYADQMENHGFDRKTFLFEADANGNAVVHRVEGKREVSHYRGDVGRCIGELRGSIQTRNTIIMVFIANTGYGAGVAYPSSGFAIIPDFPFWGTAGHELGHTFGLPHDWRGNFIMSYNPPHMLSECAALWLDLHPFFNKHRNDPVDGFSASRPKIKELPVVEYPLGRYHAFFELSDSDGLHHAQLRAGSDSSMYGCKDFRDLQGASTYYSYSSTGRGARLTVKDIFGSTTSDWISFVDVEPYMVLDISVGSSDRDTGLIGHWTFDEANGNYVFDASNMNNYATVDSGAILVFDASIFGGALKIDGSKKNATIRNSAELLNGLSAFSLSLWVKSNGTNTDRGFINGRTPNDKDEFFGFRYDKDGRSGGQRNVIKAGITTTDGTHSLESSSNAQTTEWQHLAFTWHSGQNMKLYINGALDTPSSIQPAISGTLSNVDKLVIGRGSKDRNRGWDGLIDDVRLYNRTLSADEIMQLPGVKNATSPIYGAALTGAVNNVTAETAIHEADINYTVTATNTGNRRDTIDLITSGNVNATLSETSVSLDPGASTTVRLTVPTTSVAIAGEYRVDVTATSQGDTTKTAQLTARITIRERRGITLEGVNGLTAEIQRTSQIIDFPLTLTNTGNVSEKIQLTISGDVTATLNKTSVTLAPGVSTNIKLYIPGTPLSVGDHAIKVIATSQTDTNETAELTIITYIYSGNTQNIDLQDGLLSHWSFDAVNENISADVVGNNDVTLQNGATFTPNGGQIGGAIRFDGSSDGATVTNGANLINGRTAFTLSLWIKSDYTNTDRGFIFPKTPNGSDEIFSLRYDKAGSSGKGRDVIKASIKTTGGKQSYESASDVQTTEWQHLAFTWRSGHGLTLYINGVLDQPTFNSPTTRGRVTGANVLLIGRGAKDENRSWKGFIDEVHLYNRVLSPSEIAELAQDVEIEPPVRTCSIGLEGLGDLTSQTQDASTGVTYHFNATNTGDTNNTIKLTTSGDVTGTLSRTSVLLAPVASSDETLTIPGTALTAPGQYNVKVTATSQCDSTQTAEILTTTTIYPKTRVLPNFPNPCNPETWIPYQLAKSSDVTITIYAMMGEVVRTLALGHKLSGLYQSKSSTAYWDGTNEYGEAAASGVYFYKFAADDFSAVHKMLVLK